MSCWTSETEKIIKMHESDLNSSNCREVLRKNGGYSTYLNKLGGVFRKWNGRQMHCTTVQQFQEAAQYVFGLMAIYGFNYNNGRFTVKWSGKTPFYRSADDGRCNWGEIDNLCSNPDKAKTTNCNFGMDSLYYFAGLMPGCIKLSDMYKGQARRYKVVRNKADLRIGDLVHMFGYRIASDDPDSWEDWHHVCCVGEKRGGTVIMYDSGSRFISSGDFKVPFEVDGNNEPVGSYGNYHGWVGIHVVDLVGNTGEVMEDPDYAVEVIAQKWGKGDDRAELLGKRYEPVQKLVNFYLSEEGRSDYLRAAAGYVLKGFAGRDTSREKFFGKDYADVQDKVNWTIQAARDVLDNKYGKDKERQEKLGADYDLVQAQVNRIA